MATAKKCDCCGAFYEHYNVKNDSNKTNGFALLNIDQRGQYFFHGPYDCCPKCMESIKQHIETLKKEKNND